MIISQSADSVADCASSLQCVPFPLTCLPPDFAKGTLLIHYIYFFVDWADCEGVTDTFGLGDCVVIGVIATGLMPNLSVEAATGVIAVGFSPSDKGVIAAGFIPFCKSDICISLLVVSCLLIFLTSRILNPTNIIVKTKPSRKKINARSDLLL